MSGSSRKQLRVVVVEAVSWDQRIDGGEAFSDGCTSEVFGGGDYISTGGQQVDGLDLAEEADVVQRLNAAVDDLRDLCVHICTYM